MCDAAHCFLLISLLYGVSHYADAVAAGKDGDGANARLIRREAMETYEEVVAERNRLREEVKQLQRKLYLAEIRQGACDVHGFLGNGDNYDQRWGCYPASMRAKYCMANEASKWGLSVEGDCQSNANANSSFYEFASYVWSPPSNPTKKDSQLEEPLKLEKLGGPYEPTQFSTGVFEIMQMTSNAQAYWDWPVLQFLSKMHDNQEDVSPGGYPKAQLNMQGAIGSIGGLQGKTVLVVGSISPWLESIALHNGASQVITVDYNMPLLAPEVRIKEPRLLPRRMSELLASGDTFDIVLSYSSIEHDGLGRYGDPLNPDGDLAAQKEVFLMLKSSGRYILGTAGDQVDGLWYESQRGYGPLRMPVLARGWKYEHAIEDGKPTKIFDLHGMPHNVMVFSKPNPIASTLEESYDEESCSLKCSPSLPDGTTAKCFSEDKAGKPC